MDIRNIIDTVSDGKDQMRDFNAIDSVIIHRCGVDMQMKTVLGYDGESVCRAFTDGPAKDATGGQLAYTLLIGGDCGPADFDGVIWQCAPLDEIAWHSRRFSVKGIGIGLIADPRYKEPSKLQIESLQDILIFICAAWGFDPYKTIMGHGEIPESHDGSKAPGKPAACPGDKLNMNHLRDDIAILMKENGRRKLHEIGLVFGGKDG